MAEIHRLKPAHRRDLTAKKSGGLVLKKEGKASKGATIIDLERKKSDAAAPTFTHLETDLHHRLQTLEKEQAVQAFSLNFYRDVVNRLIAIDREEDHDEFGLDPELLKKIKPLFDFLYYKYWRVSVSGIEHVPANGPAIIVANHSGTLPYDGAMIKAAILNEHPVRKDARFLVEDFVYHFPFLGTFMYRIGGVRACPENAERLLKKGHLVIVFPEGVKGIGKNFKERYELQRFGRGGFIRLALRTGSPIIPVAVVGAEEIHPLIYKSTILAKPLGIPYVPFTPTLPLLGPLGLLPLPSKWHIHFGKPIDVHKRAIHKETEALYVHQMSEKVRSTIQAMLTKGLKARQSIWWG